MPTYVLGYKDIKMRIPPVRALRDRGRGELHRFDKAGADRGIILKGICVLGCIVQNHPKDKALHTHLHQHTCVRLLSLSLSYVASKKLGLPHDLFSEMLMQPFICPRKVF